MMTASTAPNSAPAPRWGIQHSLIQPRQPAFWLFVVMLAIGGYLFIDEQSIFSQLPNALGLSWGLVLLYAVPVFVLVYRLDLFEREPKTMLAGALLWGGVVAVMLAGYANDAWLSVLGKVAPADFVSDWGAAIVAPFTEETLKLVGVVILFLIAPAEIDGVMDGFVYGAIVGLGFTITEDVSYFIHAAASFGAGDTTQPVIDTALIRLVAGGLYSHVLFAGLTGMGFAYFVTRKTETFARRLAVFLFFIAAGAGAHGLWDSPWMQTVLATAGNDKPSTIQWIEFGAIKGLPFLILLVVMVLLATRSESATFRSIVAGEPDPDVVREQELPSLGSLWARRSARSAAGRIRGPAASQLTGKLQSAQIEYSMIRSRADSIDDPSLVAQRAKIHQIRAELEALPAVPVPGTMPIPGTMPAGYLPVQPQMPTPAAPVVPTPVAPTPTPAAVAAGEAGAAPAETGAAPSTAKSARAEKAAEKARAEAAAVEKHAEIEKAAARPEHAAQAAAPVVAPSGPTIYLVPPGGMPAWAAPDPSTPPMVNLPERLEVVVDSRAGAWALVRAQNGWRGWVDGRRLVERH